jgi:hypothetical protein
MTNITQTLGFRNGRLNRLVRPLGRLQLSCRQHLLDHWNELAEQIGLPKGVPAGQPYLALRLTRLFGGDAKGNRNDCIELDDVRKLRTTLSRA